MHLRSVQIWNYKSFVKSPVVELGARATLLVGRNNAGKTALLDAISGQLVGESAHRSLAVLPRLGDRPKSEVRRDYVLDFSGRDLRDFLERSTATFSLPIVDTTVVSRSSKNTLENAFASDGLTLRWSDGEFVGDFLGVPRNAPGRGSVTSMGHLGLKYNEGGYAGPNDLEQALSDHFYRERMFRFHASRNVTSSFAHPRAVELANDASNLAAVLLTLKSDRPSVFERIELVVKDFLPELAYLVSRVSDSSAAAEIGVMYEVGARDRRDLVFLLDRCGTGVGQVVALVTAIVSAQEPRTVIIDEPNSFLHPGATTKLVELIGDYPQHQYVIATHSPEIIANMEAERVYLLEFSEGKTEVASMNASEIASQRRVLADVGASLSSVFGADRVLWVEGPTEEHAFEPVLHRFLPEQKRGLRILAMADTGAFDGKHAKRAHDLYQRLTRGSALVPPVAALLLDREKRTDEQIARLQQDCPNLRFLKRRMTENYLLDVDAIVAILNEDIASASELQDSTLTISAGQVAVWLEQHGDDIKLGASSSRAEDEKAWAATVHGSGLLTALFKDLSAGRTYFQKPGTSERLARWLASSKPNVLEPLAEELREILT